MRHVLLTILRVWHNEGQAQGMLWLACRCADQYVVFPLISS
jgi:hypothetical protein